MDRRHEPALAFRDPEGLGLELAVVDCDDEPLRAVAEGIAPEHALLGFDGVRAYSLAWDEEEPVLTGAMGFTMTGPGTYVLASGRRRASYVHDRPPAAVGIQGAGTLHHIAWCDRDAEHTAWREHLRRHGMHLTAVIDRMYFLSIYFREPRGVLFELATPNPGYQPTRTGDATLSTDLDLLEFELRTARGAPEGALILLHGRGTDQFDLLPLLGELDPGRRLVGVTARAPLELSPGGFHWYISRQVGYPDGTTFHRTYSVLERWLDALPDALGVPWSATVFGGSRWARRCPTRYRGRGIHSRTPPFEVQDGPPRTTTKHNGRQPLPLDPLTSDSL